MTSQQQNMEMSATEFHQKMEEHGIHAIILVPGYGDDASDEGSILAYLSDEEDVFELGAEQVYFKLKSLKPYFEGDAISLNSENPDLDTFAAFQLEVSQDEKAYAHVADFLITSANGINYPAKPKAENPSGIKTLGLAPTQEPIPCRLIVRSGSEFDTKLSAMLGLMLDKNKKAPQILTLQ